MQAIDSTEPAEFIAAVRRAAAALSLAWLLSACAIPSSPVRQVGVLGDPALSEASGMIVSGCEGGGYWVVNDGDNPSRLYRIDDRGRVLARARVDAPNVDWEDLDARRSPGRRWLVIADVGDNAGRRDTVTVLFVPEPCVAGETATVAARLELTFPDGPRDAEAVAVDPTDDTLWVISKRTLPPVLYSVALDDIEATGTTRRTLRWAGPLATLIAPSARELEQAPLTGIYRWQPTALAIRDDALAILTSGNAYYYPRVNGESVGSAVSRPPRIVPLPPLKDAEAMSFDATGRYLDVTSELVGAPVYRIDLSR